MMLLFKIVTIVFLAVIFFIFRKWFLKHYYFLLAFIPIIILILYADYFIQLPGNKKRIESAELEKWKEEHKDNFISEDKINYMDSATKLSKIGEVLYDTTFSVNSLKVHYKEFLIALPANVYSYPSTQAVLEIIDKNDSTIQTITEDIYAIGSPIDKGDGYNMLADDGIFQDYNFDGALDIILRVGNGRDTQALNGEYYLYLYNPDTYKFNKYKKKLYNPVPDEEKKMVYFFNIISSYDEHTITEYCKWVNDSLVLKESIEGIFIPEDSDEHLAKYKITTKHYKDDKVISSKEEIKEVHTDDY